MARYLFYNPVLKPLPYEYTLHSHTSVGVSQTIVPGKYSANYSQSLPIGLCGRCQDEVHPHRYQYNETNVMHFSFNLLEFKGLYMFRALLAHPQEALYKRNLV
jgi:hypothetical protein